MRNNRILDSAAREGLAVYRSRASLRRPHFVSLRSGLNTRSTWRFSALMMPMRANTLAGRADGSGALRRVRWTITCRRWKGSRGITDRKHQFIAER
jgi:hypothetical protein